MRWHGLGHAMWLVEAEGLRLLFDPLLEDRHHGGVFDVRPRRRVHAEALRPDFVLVSHRHGDHFDVRSLARLAAMDADAPLVTPDELVAWAARAVGFRTVHLLPPGQKVDLDRVRVVTTPSVAEVEWGAVVECEDGMGWNQVDTVFRGVADVERVVGEVLGALGRPAADRFDLLVARWQPLREIQAPMCEDLAFPLALYAGLLAETRASRGRTVVPGAAGQEQVGAYGWMNAHGYPVPEARYLRDLAALAPEVRALPHRVGSTYVIGGGEVAHELEGARALAEPLGAHEPWPYRPFVVPELADPGIGRAGEGVMRARVGRWMEDVLGPALARAWPGMGVSRELRFGVEVVWTAAREEYGFAVGPSGVVVERRVDPDWDVLDAVAGSMLFEVIEGRFHWGDVLLGGMLRATSRAYDVREGSLRRGGVGKTFLYYGLPYDEANERAVRHEVREVCEEAAR